ncbi:MAG: hypothetical protein ACI965_001445, partial [Paraglaciecola sp.]
MKFKLSKMTMATLFAGLMSTGSANASLNALAAADPVTAAAPVMAAKRDLVTAADIGLDFAPRLLHVDAPTLAARNAVNALGLDITEHASNGYVEVLAYSSQDINVLRDAGFTWDVAIADLILHESQRAAADAAFAKAVSISNLPSGRVGYRNLVDFGTDIDALVARNGDIAKKISIGKSLEGRDLTGIEIGRDVNAAEDGRPVFLMF